VSQFGHQGGQILAEKFEFVVSWMLGRPYDEVIVAVAFGSGEPNSSRPSL
jgi:hypothetical protein